MRSTTIQVRNKLGLHARAAAQLVRVASGFESEITLVDGAKSADAKGIMGLMMLAATQGTELELRIDGPDEAVADKAVQQLFDSGFGENEI
ncbi:MAG: HPr family phosphocarrier protein [Acidiferrobacterales bacterium]|nr:HPr family phosphocarrier protein [Acidiferrobacterales bacterium]